MYLMFCLNLMAIYKTVIAIFNCLYCMIFAHVLVLYIISTVVAAILYHQPPQILNQNSVISRSG